MSENYDNGSESASFRNMLLDEAQPELYRRNAFRVLGLPGRATEREVRKYLRELKLRREFGIGESIASGSNHIPAPLPLSPPPDAELVAEAQSRLTRPERRLIDEFFWFWSSDVDTLTALKTNDIESASDFLGNQTWSSEVRWVAAHDMAIMFHATALDIEWAATHNIPVTHELKQRRDKCWQNCIAIWRMMLSREGAWEYLRTRIGEVDDPRVTLVMANDLHATLPTMLITINARLAAQASQRGETTEAQRHTAIMRDFNFDEESIEEARQIVVGPLRQRIYDLCQALDLEARSAPEGADQSVQRLLKQSRPILIAINDLLPERDPRISDARDVVTASANDAAVAKYSLLPSNAAREWVLAKEFFKRLRVIAASAPMREVMEQNIAWADRHISKQQTTTSAQQPQSGTRVENKQDAQRQTCWFCMRREEDGFPEVLRLYKRDATQNLYYYDDVLVPRCSGCYAIHQRARDLSIWGGIAGVAAGSSICTGLIITFWTEIGVLINSWSFLRNPLLLLFVAVIVLFALFGLGDAIVYRKVWPNISGGIRPVEQRMSYPRVMELQGEGWSPNKPNN